MGVQAQAVVPYQALIIDVASRFQLDAKLLAAQVLVESSGKTDAFRWEPGFYTRYIAGNPKVVAKAYGPLAACSYGLLQIMLETAMELGYAGRPEGLFDPQTGLIWGARYLRGLLDWAGGDVEKALCAYNGGKGSAVSKPYPTQSYANKVFATMGSL